MTRKSQYEAGRQQAEKYRASKLNPGRGSYAHEMKFPGERSASMFRKIEDRITCQLK